MNNLQDYEVRTRFASFQSVFRILAEAWHNSNIPGQKANICLPFHLYSLHTNVSFSVRRFIRGFPAFFYIMTSPPFLYHKVTLYRHERFVTWSVSLTFSPPFANSLLRALVFFWNRLKMFKSPEGGWGPAWSLLYNGSPSFCCYLSLFAWVKTSCRRSGGLHKAEGSVQVKD